MNFPPRDPNERVLMSSLGVDSPMFDYVEQISGKPTPSKTDNGDMLSSTSKKQKKESEQERMRKELEK